MTVQNAVRRVAASTYVTRTARILIAVAGVALPASIYLCVRSHAIFFSEQAPDAPQPPPWTPAPVQFLFTHIAWAPPALMFASAYALVAAIGLLLRKDWARRLLVAFLALGFAGCIALIAVAVNLLQWNSREPAELRLLMTILLLPTFPVSLGLGLWLACTLVKLTSREIRSEFVPTCTGRDPHSERPS